ncbi:hypothetical protein ACOBQX_03475 [Actinokineospora sp. G85]|uniref:hypothetical protein n=1 Tax=Actinokineospora sp. G85 TaxID=3406626 RepID=UPI003C74DBA5
MRRSTGGAERVGWRSAIAGASPVLLLLACAGAPSEPAPATAPAIVLPSLDQIAVDPGSIPDIGDSTGLPMELDVYRWSDAELSLVAQALNTLTGDCAERFGVAVPDSPDSGPREPEDMSRRYGLTSAAEAGATGYRFQATPGPTPARAPLDEDATAVLYGGKAQVRGKAVPPRGCAGQATTEISGADHAGPAEAVQDINSASWSLSRRHPLVTAAFARWSACLRPTGTTYGDPVEAMNDDRFTGQPTADEIEVAKADVACKVVAGTTGAWHTVEMAVQRAMIEANRPVLEEAQRAKARQLAKARQVVGRE